MTTETKQTKPAMTPTEAVAFDGYSVANALAVTSKLDCGCEPYVDVFTYRRWSAQGYQVQSKQKGIKVPVMTHQRIVDEETGDVTFKSFRTNSALFCKHQVSLKT